MSWPASEGPQVCMIDASGLQRWNTIVPSQSYHEKVATTAIV